MKNSGPMDEEPLFFSARGSYLPTNTCFALPGLPAAGGLCSVVCLSHLGLQQLRSKALKPAGPLEPEDW